MKKSNTMQTVHITKNLSQLAKPKVVAFMGKIEHKKYPKAVWNYIQKTVKRGSA